MVGGFDSVSVIKRLRLEKGWSQKRLAEEAGLSQSFIHSVETGEKSPTIRSIRKIAKALGVPVEKIIHEGETK
nr:MAG: XRE family transcriptional regulator [Chloroflexota bacterium]